MDAPDKALEIKAAITAVIAFGTALFGWIGWAVIIWLCAMVLDYLTGTFAAMSTGTWSSKAARKGLWHKLGSIAAVLVAALCDIALSFVTESFGKGILPLDYSCIVTPVVVLWYTFTELGSITENAAKLGAPLPAFLLKIIQQVRESAEENGGK